MSPHASKFRDTRVHVSFCGSIKNLSFVTGCGRNSGLGVPTERPVGPPKDRSSERSTGGKASNRALGASGALFATDRKTKSFRLEFLSSLLPDCVSPTVVIETEVFVTVQVTLTSGRPHSSFQLGSPGLIGSSTVS
jgi:hypothetical protein